MVWAHCSAWSLGLRITLINQSIIPITKFRMIGHNFGAIAVQYEEGVLDSCSPAIFTKIVRQDFLRLSIKLPDTVSITREDEKSDTLIIRDIEDDTVRTSMTSSLYAFSCTICRLLVYFASLLRSYVRKLPVSRTQVL
jgi:hypothetical protein